MNRDRLGRMRPDSYLINVGRGPLVDEDALLEAIRNEKIAGAGLDVFVEEPLPPKSPFWNLENILITPHTAAVTDRLWDRHYQLICENLKRFLERKLLLNLVNKHKGY